MDINVLLRYLLRDDEAQAEGSRRVFERDERILITDVVLAESVWTLIGRRYRANQGRRGCRRGKASARTQRGL